MSILEYVKLKDIEQFSIHPNRAVQLIGNPVEITIPCYDGQDQPVHPSVVVIPDGWNGYKYWMSFTPYTSGQSAVENPSIVASNDGVTWVVPAGLTNPIVAALTAPAFNRDSELIYIPSEGLRLYWGDSLGGAYYKASSDGVTWGASVPITGGVFGSVQASICRKSATEWLGWGQQVGIAQDNLNVGNMSRFTSVDGVTWKYAMPARTNLASKIWHVGMLADAVGYHFLACVYPSGLNNTNMDLIYGYSEDGINIEFDSTPILKVARSGENFFDSKLYKSCIIPFGENLYRIYFSYRQILNGKWLIGYQDIQLNTPSSLLSLARTPKKKSVERIIFNALEIRDTNIKYYGGEGSPWIIPEFNEYENKVLLVRSTLDQPVDISVVSMLRGNNLWDILYKDVVVSTPAPVRAIQSYYIPASTASPGYIDKTSMGSLGVILPSCSSIRVKATSTAPTTGDITLIMISW